MSVHERIAAMFAMYATWLETKGVKRDDWAGFFWQMILDGKRVGRECNFIIRRVGD